MVRGGRHDIDAYLDLAAALADDETAGVTAAIAARLEYVADYLVRPADQPRYQAWLRQRFGSVLQALGVPGDPGDSDERQSRRATLLDLVGVVGNDPALQRTARDLALRYIAQPESLPGTLAPTVLRVAAAGGDAALYDQYLAQVQKLAGQPEEYYRFFGALPRFRDPALVRRTLEFAVSPAVRSQDTGTLIAALMTQIDTQDAAWAFTKAQWPTLVEKLGTFQGIPTIVNSLSAFCSQEKADDIRRFFEANPVPSAARGLQQALERIEACTALAARQSAPAAAWVAGR
jgi:aminopeptidase N/puromycin-sensitive aminopeptidase